MRVGREPGVDRGRATRVGGGDHIDIDEAKFIRPNSDINRIDESRTSWIWKDFSHIAVPFVSDDGYCATHAVKVLAAGTSLDICRGELDDSTVWKNLVEGR